MTTESKETVTGAPPVRSSDLLGHVELPPGPFSIIYADPPWMYEGNLHDGRGYARDHYSTQEPDWIARLPVAQVAAWDSVCFMWATYPKLQEALYVLRAWGYEYKTVAFTWVKINPSTKRHYFGMGQYTRANSEICLLGTRGKTLERKDKGVPQLLECNVSDHSRKPDEARDRIVRLYGDVPRLEMFARHDPSDMVNRFHGWTLWGNESNGAECPNKDSATTGSDNTGPVS
jgi:N6-adenosine-specific RNA methylase IME4